MAFLWLILALQALASVKSDIIDCDQPGFGKQLCKVNRTMENQLIALWPDFFSLEPLLNLSSLLIIETIPEFNENEETITVHAILKLVWNDTRITIKSDDPDW